MATNPRTTLKEAAALEGVSARALYMRRWRARHPEHRDYMRAWTRARRARVLAHYGAACVCCGVTTYEFLAIDHKNGGGNKHRAEVGRGGDMLKWIIDNDFPDEFQVMCHNCNQAIGFYGVCPHQLGEE